MQSMATLRTERLKLRMFREADLDAYDRICADPEVMRFIGEGRPYTRAEAWRNMALFIGHWRLRGLAMEERSSGSLIGRAGCFMPEGWPGFEIGWLLGREYWGRGFATEGGRAVLDYAFHTLGRDHVISVIHPENVRSIRVAERLGEKFEGKSQLQGKQVSIYGIRRLDARTG